MQPQPHEARLSDGDHPVGEQVGQRPAGQGGRIGGKAAAAELPEPCPPSVPSCPLSPGPQDGAAVMSSIFSSGSYPRYPRRGAVCLTDRLVNSVRADASFRQADNYRVDPLAKGKNLRRLRKGPIVRIRPANCALRNNKPATAQLGGDGGAKLPHRVARSL